MESTTTAKEYLMFVLLCLLAMCAVAYLTYRANRFDTYYEERSMMESGEVN